MDLKETKIKWIQKGGRILSSWKGRIHLSPDFTLSSLQESLQPPLQAIHRSKRSFIARKDLSQEDSPLLLKFYVSRNFGQAPKAFWNGLYLASQGFPTPKPWAYLSLQHLGIFPGPSLLITPFLCHSLELHWFVKYYFSHEENLQKKENFLSSLAEFYSSLVKQKLFHHDLSPQNVLAKTLEEKFIFYLVDLEDIQWVSYFTPNYTLRNLVQLLDLPRWIGPEDRSIFLNYLQKNLPKGNLAIENLFLFLDQLEKGLAKRRKKRVLRDGKDWLFEAEEVPGKGKLPSKMNGPTLPPKDTSLPKEWSQLQDLVESFQKE